MAAFARARGGQTLLAAGDGVARKLRSLRTGNALASHGYRHIAIWILSISPSARIAALYIAAAAHAAGAAL